MSKHSNMPPGKAVEQDEEATLEEIHPDSTAEKASPEAELTGLLPGMAPVERRVTKILELMAEQNTVTGEKISPDPSRSKPSSPDEDNDEDEDDTSALPRNISKNRPPQHFEAANTALLLANLEIEAERKEAFQIPRARAVTYLILDKTTVEREKANPRFIANITALLSEPKSYITTDQQGNLVYLSLSERGAANKVVETADSLAKITTDCSILISKGILRDQGNGDFSLDNYPHSEAKASWRTKDNSINRISVDADLARTIKNPDSRLGSNIVIYTADTSNPNIVRLIRYETKTADERGGTDIMIGYEGHLEKLTTSLNPQDPARLILVEGPAGIGKSRIVTEALDKNSFHIRTSMDPANKNVQGSSLATLAKLLDQKLKELGLKSNIVVHPSAAKEDLRFPTLMGIRKEDDQEMTFSKFTKLTGPEQNNYSTRNPDVIKILCLSALKSIAASYQGQSAIFIMEDLHHADRTSEPCLMELVKDFLKDRPSNKAVLPLRPNEIDVSAARRELLNQLQDFFPDESWIQSISLQSGLDLDNDELAKKFAYHSLPKAYRKGKTLGTWYIQLGQLAKKSPWRMKSFMDKVKTKKYRIEKDSETGKGKITHEYEYLYIQDGVIMLREDLIAEITSLAAGSDADIAGYLEDNISTLDKAPKQTLQCIALMDSEVSESQMDLIIEEVVGVAKRNNLQHTLIKNSLIDGGQVVEVGEDCYAISHENTREIILGSISQEEKIHLAKSLHKVLGKSTKRAAKSKELSAQVINIHALLNIIAAEKDPKASDEEFWHEYAENTYDCLRYAHSHNDQKLTEHLATMDLDLPTILTTIRKLETGENISGIMRELAISTLFAAAESSRFLGKFEDLQQYINRLTAIHQQDEEKKAAERALNSPSATATRADIGKKIMAQTPAVQSCPIRVSNIDMIRVKIIEFEAAYMKSQGAVMRRIYREDFKDGDALDPATKIMMNIKLINKGGHNPEHFQPDDFDEAERLINTHFETLKEYAMTYLQLHGSDCPELIDAIRIAVTRCPFEKIRTQVVKITQDTTFDHDVLAQARGLKFSHRKALKAVAESLEKIKANQAKNPLIFNLYSELNILDEEAYILAFEGEGDKAVNIFKEICRRAEQANMHTVTVRAAKIAGDIRITQAMSKNPIDLKTLRDGLKMYSEFGEPAAISTQDFNYGNLIHMQRLRGLSILVDQLSLPQKPATTTEIEESIATALQDFNSLCQNYQSLKDLDPEAIYDIMSSIGHLLKAANKFGISVNTENWPAMDFESVGKGLEFSYYKTDLQFGEVARKRKGFYKLLNIIRESKLSKPAASQPSDEQNTIEVDKMNDVIELSKALDRSYKTADRTIQATLENKLRAVITDDITFIDARDAALWQGHKTAPSP